MIARPRDTPRNIEEWRAAVALRERLDSLLIRRMAQLHKLQLSGHDRSLRIIMRAWLTARRRELTA